MVLGYIAHLDPRNHVSPPSLPANARIASRNSSLNPELDVRTGARGKGRGVLRPVSGTGGGLSVVCKETEEVRGLRIDENNEGVGAARS